MYLDDMSPGQHLAVMVTAGVTIVAILAGGCWTYRQRRGFLANSTDSTADLQENGILLIFLANRTIGRAFGTVCHLSSVVCL